VNKTGFPKTKRPGFSSPYLLFVIRLWTCHLTCVQTTYESTCVNFFCTIRRQKNKMQKVGRNFTSFGTLVWAKISEKFSQNSFFLKFYVRISTEFGTKRDKFQVKRMSIDPRKKANSFTHERTFFSALKVINKKFITILVGWI